MTSPIDDLIRVRSAGIEVLRELAERSAAWSVEHWCLTLAEQVAQMADDTPLEEDVHQTLTMSLTEGLEEALPPLDAFSKASASAVGTLLLVTRAHFQCTQVWLRGNKGVEWQSLNQFLHETERMLTRELETVKRPEATPDDLRTACLRVNNALVGISHLLLMTGPVVKRAAP